MAVDFFSSGEMGDHAAIQEAAAAGIHSLEHLVFQLSHCSQPVDYLHIADETVAKFKEVISIIDRTGHARFRRGPRPEPPAASSALADTPNASPAKAQTTAVAAPPPTITLDFSKPTADPVTAATAAGKPRLTFTGKRHAHSGDTALKIAASGSCHCTKKKKSRMKKTIRVLAISPKIAEIPPDDFLWRKYGQKVIKDSPYPRSYYRCSILRACPAVKHVERARDDPSMLIVTYVDEHRHGPNRMAAPPSADGAVESIRRCSH